MDQYSPKSSPLGARSPSITQNAEASSGLKLTISLKQPFYLMRPDAAPSNETTGATNLMAARGLEHSFNKLTTKKMKESLSSFLPSLPGVIDTPGAQDNSALRGIIEKPPVCGKELQPLNQLQLAGFRLHPGPLPEQYRGLLTQVHPKRKHKHKRPKYSSSGAGGDAEANGSSKGDEERERRREKKHKRHEKDADEKKKKKKEKKKKRSKEDKE